jgi:hypothetical protein
MYKIAFLFLTLDNPNFPEIWDLYFKGYEEYINIYIHPKYPENVTWKKENIIDNLKKTEWGFIVKAYIALFKTALKDKDNIKFITISESCLPIKPFKLLYDFVMKNKHESFIKFLKISNYDYKVRISNEIKDKFKNLIKHYARMCLSRYHVKKLLKYNNILKLFYKMHVGDEFFLNIINKKKLIKNITDFDITFDDWNFIKKKREQFNLKIKKLYELQENNNIDLHKKIVELQSIRDNFSKNPKTIINVSKTDISNILNSSCFFYRKFSKDSDILKYYYNNIINIKD